MSQALREVDVEEQEQFLSNDDGKVRGHPGPLAQVLPSFTCLFFNFKDGNPQKLDGIFAWGQDQKYTARLANSSTIVH